MQYTTLYWSSLGCCWTRVYFQFEVVINNAAINIRAHVFHHFFVPFCWVYAQEENCEFKKFCVFFQTLETYLFIQLCWVLVAACGIFFTVVQRLSCSVAYGILVLWPQIKLTSRALQCRFWTTAPLGKSHVCFKLGQFCQKFLKVAELICITPIPKHPRNFIGVSAIPNPCHNLV